MCEWKRGSGSVRARNTLKWRRAECAERERAIDTSSSEAPRPCQLTAEFSPLAGNRRGRGERPPPPRFALPSTLPTPRPSPPLGALCKSPHMLPRVPVSQRHSRASFCTHRNVVTDCRKGTIKRVLSLSPPLIHGYELPIRISLLHTGTRDGRTVCTYACARGVLFSASLGARHNLSRATTASRRSKSS